MNCLTDKRTRDHLSFTHAVRLAPDLPKISSFLEKLYELCLLSEYINCKLLGTAEETNQGEIHFLQIYFCAGNVSEGVFHKIRSMFSVSP